MNRQKEKSRQWVSAKLVVGVTLALLWGLLPACAQNMQRHVTAPFEKQIEAIVSKKVAAAQEQLEAAFTKKMEALNKKLAARAESVDEVTMDKSSLQFASQFLGAKPQDRKVKQLLGNLNGIYVRDYQFTGPGQYSMQEVNAIRELFVRENWQPMVHTRQRSKKGGSATDIYMKAANGKLEGMLVLDAEPTKLSIVYISGSIRPEQLSDLGGSFGVPKIQPKNHGLHDLKESVK